MCLCWQPIFQLDEDRHCGMWGLDFVPSLKRAEFSSCNGWLPLADQGFYPKLSRHTTEWGEWDLPVLQTGNKFVLLYLLFQPRSLDVQRVVAPLCEHGLHALTLMEIMKRVRKLHFNSLLCSFHLSLTLVNVGCHHCVLLSVEYPSCVELLLYKFYSNYNLRWSKSI